MSLLLALQGGTSPDITVAASGVSGTGQVGNLASQITLAITGNQATTALGTLVEGDALILASVSATGQVGTAAPSITVPLTGTAGTGNLGNFGVKLDLPITGNQSTGQVGNLSVAAGADVTVSATGVSGTGQVGDLVFNFIPDITTYTNSGGSYYISYTYEEELQIAREKAAHSTFVKQAAVQAVTQNYYSPKSKIDTSGLKILRSIANDLQIELDKNDKLLLKLEIKHILALREIDDEEVSLLL